MHDLIRTFLLVPSPTGQHPARGNSGVCMCIHVCLVWCVFPTVFTVPLHLIIVMQVLQLPVQTIYNPSGRRSKGVRR